MYYERRGESYREGTKGFWVQKVNKKEERGDDEGRKRRALKTTAQLMQTHQRRYVMGKMYLRNASK